MSSSVSTDQAQRRDSSNPSSSTHTKASSSSERVLPGTKTSEQTGPGAQSSQSPTTSPVGTSTNINNQKPGSPPPSRSSSSASSSVSHRSTAAGSKSKAEDDDIWSQAIQGPNVPEEVKAIVRTGRHAWSRGIAQKTSATATPAMRR